MSYDFDTPSDMAGYGEIIGANISKQVDVWLLSGRKKSKQETAEQNSNSGPFNSVLIPFRHAEMLDKWKARFNDLQTTLEPACDEHTDHCMQRVQTLKQTRTRAEHASFSEKLALANKAVNTLITYKSDEQAYGVLDYWASPKESLKHGFGDCEDYAILKMALLTEFGVPAGAMSMIVVKDIERDLFHAVLAIRTNRGTLLLDNLHENVIGDEQAQHYLPLFSFSQHSSWLHGWRKDSTQKVIAKRALANMQGVLPGGSGQQKDTSLNGDLNSESDQLFPISWAL